MARRNPFMSKKLAGKLLDDFSLFGSMPFYVIVTLVTYFAGNRLLFERKDIREYTSWSFAQVRNGFRTLRDYEYIQLIRSQNGVASQYRLNGSYGELDFLSRILTPQELAARLAGSPRT